MPNLISELKKRKVFSSSAIYLGTAFIILQVVSIIIPALLIPDWVLRLFVVLAILGFPIVIVLSWIYDIGDKGFVKTESEQPRTEGETHHQGMSKSSMIGILTSIIITIIMIYKGVDYFTSSTQTSNKISIAVISFDNIREFKEYDWLEERIARNLTFKLGEMAEIRTIDRLQILNKLGEINPNKASVMDYKINQIAKNIDVDLILHGSFTIMDKDNIIEITAFFADINTSEQINIMLEQYPLEELSDIPSYINEKITLFIKSDQRFKQTPK